MVVAVEHGVFGTAHDQTVETYDFLLVKIATPKAKLREGAVRFALVNRGVEPNPNRESGGQGNDSVRKVRIVCILDRDREVACKKWAIVKVVV